MKYGAELLTACLEALGVEHVFGLPGTQNLAIFEALRRSRLRAVVASDEMAACFMACGYARAGARLGVVTTIPGPGFTYALTALAEARADSAALLYITLRQRDNGRRFQLQMLDQQAIAAPIVKACVTVQRIEELVERTLEAARLALCGEPGPVMLEIDAGVMGQQLDRLPPVAAEDADDRTVRADRPFDEDTCARLIARLRDARRPLVLAGQGAQSSATALRAWCERSGTPLITTGSGRGVLPETHSLCLPRSVSGEMPITNELIAAADAVLVLGCKLSHNGSGGYALRLPQERLLQVDSCADVIGANYPVSAGLVASCAEFLDRLGRSEAVVRSEWSEDELAGWRARYEALRARPPADQPVLRDAADMDLPSFFARLRAVLPAPLIHTTDSGRNQELTRAWAQANCPCALIMPADFQSMGFGLPAAIGARLARPEAAVLACIGDGGFLQMATELLTAVREGIDLTVLVFDDGKFGYIERQQLEQFGAASGTALGQVDYAAIARGFGCEFIDGTAAPDPAAFSRPGVRLLVLPLDESARARLAALGSRLRETVARTAPRSLLRRARALLGGARR